MRTQILCLSAYTTSLLFNRIFDRAKFSASTTARDETSWLIQQSQHANVQRTQSFSPLFALINCLVYFFPRGRGNDDAPLWFGSMVLNLCLF